MANAEIDAARLLTLQAAALKDAGRPCTPGNPRCAKLFAAEAAYEATSRQSRSRGNGYTKEIKVERYFRDAKITEIYEGTSEVQRIVIANHVLDDPVENRERRLKSLKPPIGRRASGRRDSPPSRTWNWTPLHAEDVPADYQSALGNPGEYPYTRTITLGYLVAGAGASSTASGTDSCTATNSLRFNGV